jgi:hypothetical protein
VKAIEAEAKINSLEASSILDRMFGGAKNQQEAYTSERLHTFELAILVILSLIQSKADYNNVLQHMSLNLTEKVDIEQSEKRLYHSLGVYGRSKMRKLKSFKEILDDEDKKVIYPDSPPIQKPVGPNSAVIQLIQQREETPL